MRNVRKLQTEYVCVGLILLGIATVRAQENAGLYHQLLNTAAAAGLIGTGEPLKCGTALLFALASEEHEKLLEWKGERGRVSRPIREKSRLSPSGKFRVHYDTTGVFVPAMLNPVDMTPIPGTYEQYVDSLMANAEYSLAYLTSVLGFDPPPNDGMLGGGPEYDIYIEDLGPDGFGVTLWEEPFATTPNQKFLTYIVIDNDFYGNRTPGLNGLRVTLAHELHHAIQLGSYGVWTGVPNADFHFYEATSTWIESIVFPSVPDFLIEARKYFTQFRDTQGRSLSLSYYPGRSGDPFFPGYERFVWVDYLSARFGQHILRHIWDGMKSKPYLRSLAEILEERSTSVESEVARFSVWNYYTADRADSTRSYRRGNLYPRFLRNAFASFSGGTATVSWGAYPLSTQMIELAMASDTIVAVIANVNIGSAQSASLTTPQPMSVTLSTSGAGEATQVLQKGTAVSFRAVENRFWRVVYLAASTDAVATENTLPSPNPYSLTGPADLIIPLHGAAGKVVEVAIYSVSLDLLYAKTFVGRNYFGREEVAIPGSDLRLHIPSGVHFVVVNHDGQTHWWKVAFLK